MTQTTWPVLTVEIINQEDVLNAVTQISDVLREASRIRENEDIPDFGNLNQVFVSGRSTDRVPSSPTDVLADDAEGDVVIQADGAFEYTLIDVSGTLKWDRRTLDTAW